MTTIDFEVRMDRPEQRDEPWQADTEHWRSRERSPRRERRRSRRGDGIVRTALRRGSWGYQHHQPPPENTGGTTKSAPRRRGDKSIQEEGGERRATERHEHRGGGARHEQQDAAGGAGKRRGGVEGGEGGKNRRDDVGDVSPVAEGHDTDDTHAGYFSGTRAQHKSCKISPPPDPRGDAGGKSAPEKACRAESDPTDEANAGEGVDPCQNQGDHNGYKVGDRIATALAPAMSDNGANSGAEHTGRLLMGEDKTTRRHRVMTKDGGYNVADHS